MTNYILYNDFEKKISEKMFIIVYVTYLSYCVYKIFDLRTNMHRKYIKKFKQTIIFLRLI